MAVSAPVGLDIGSTSIRAVEVSRTRNRPSVANFGRAVLPDGAVSGGVVTDERVVVAALKQLWATHRFSTRSVLLGISHQQVVVRELEVSNLPPKELRQALAFQASEVLPLPVDEAVLDFYPLDRRTKAPTVRGLLVAAPKQAVADVVSLVERAGLHVAQVDLSCFAALRAAAHLARDTEALVDIGACTTNVVIHTDGVPRIVRTVPRGGAEITRLVASRLGVPAAEAESLKCRIGLDRDASGEVAEVVAEAVRPLVGEIRSSFSYYASSHEDARVDRLALVGGGALLPGLADLLRDTLHVPVVLSNPMRRVDDPGQGGRHDELNRYRSSAAVSIGLTLAAA